MGTSVCVRAHEKSLTRRPGPPPSATSLLSLSLCPFHSSPRSPSLPASLSSPLLHLLQPTLFRSSSLDLFCVCSPLVSAKTWSPWYQLWHKLQLFTDFSRDNLVTQFHSQISTFVPIAWHKQSHTGHSFKGIPEQRSCSKKWGVGQSGHEQIHSNPTYNSSLGKAQEELSHPRTSDNKRIVLGRDAQDIHPSASLLTPSHWPRFLSITLIPKGDREPQTVT